MPSTAQRGDSDASYQPSDYADDFSEDPAKILAKNEETVIAVVKGTNDLDLLNAYLDVEASREARQNVIGALNERKQTVSTCPRECDAPVMDRFETREEFQIKHQNAVQHKTCVTLAETESGEEAMIVVFHDEPEPEPDPEPTEEPPQEADDEVDDTDTGDEEPAEDDDAEEADDDELIEDEPVGQRPKALFHRMRQEDGTMNLAGIKGWCGNEFGISPDETKHVLDTLVNGDYVEEVEDGIYTCPPGDEG